MWFFTAKTMKPKYLEPVRFERLKTSFLFLSEFPDSLDEKETKAILPEKEVGKFEFV